ncbi:NAD-dependent epimerase/dehydratase family protein [Lacinutrix salivirga]
MILVTGGTGLVGSHLLYTLVSDGKTVKATYRNEAKLASVKHVFSYYTEDYDALFKTIIWVKAELSNIPDLTEAFKDIDYVYHCAALISFDPKRYHNLRKTNIEGTANIVNLSLAYGVKKLCYVSSIAALGKELDHKLITETTAWNPENDNSVYAITKYGAEMEVWRGTQEGLDAVIVNPGVIIGPGYWHTGSGYLFKWVYKGLSHYTSGSTGYVDVLDVVAIMKQLMESTIKNESYITIAANWSFKQFTEAIAKSLKVSPPKKEAGKLLLQMAWRLDWLKQKLTGKSRKLTKQTANSARSKSEFDNSKVKTALNYTFIPVEKSIKDTSALFLKDVK